MCGNKGSEQTQTTSTAPPPEVMKAYQGILSRAQTVADTPYQAYGGQRVADFTADQQAGFQGVRNAQGISEPYFDQAGQYIQQATGPITSQQIQGYMDPYTQQVIDATAADFAVQNERQLDQVTGNAALQGALGGNRVEVAKALAAEQQNRVQNPILANMRSQGYSQALSAAQQDAARQLQGAGLSANVGTAAQNAALTDATALLGAGGQQQALGQAQLDVPYQDFLEQRAYPFQTTQWLAGINSSIAPHMGQTQTTTQPGANPLNSIIGGVTAGVGTLGATGAFGSTGWLAPLMLSDERAKEDIIPVGEMFDGTPLYRFRYKGDPQTQIGVMAQDVEQTNPGAVADIGGLKAVDMDSATRPAAIRGQYAGGGVAIPYGDVNTGVPMVDLPMARAASPQAMPQRPEDPGMATMLNKLTPALKGIREGYLSRQAPTTGWEATVTPAVPQMAVGGAVDGFKPMGVLSALSGDGGFQPMGLIDVLQNGGGMGLIDVMKDKGFGSAIDAVKDRDDMSGLALAEGSGLTDIGGAMPMRAIGGVVDLEEGEGGIYAPVAEVQSQPQPQQKSEGSFATNPWMALTNAGLRMMASRSPNVGQAIGEGGMAGIQTLGEQHTRRLQEERTALEAQRVKDATAIARAKLAQGPEATALMRNLEAAGIKPGTPEYRDAVLRGIQQGTTVNVSPGEKSYDQELGKALATEFVESQKSGAKAAEDIGDLRVMEKAVADPNLYTGAGGETIHGLKKAAQTLFGVEVQGVPEGEIVQRISSKVALSLKDQLPGPMSDSDREFLRSIPANLSTSPEGARRVIALGIAQKQWMFDRAKAVQQFASENQGRLTPEVYGVLGQIDEQWGQRMSGIVDELRSQPQAGRKSPGVGVDDAFKKKYGLE